MSLLPHATPTPAPTTASPKPSLLAAMGTHLLLVLLILAFLSTTPSYAAASPHISAVISQSGLDYAKDLLVSRAAATLTPLSVPDIERSVSIPVIGTVHMVASGIVLDGVAVANSTVAVGDSGVVVSASLSSVNLTMEWSYLYSAWVVTISDSGNASIHVEGMDVGISMEMKNQNGSLKLFVMECGCHVKDLDITLNGGASWFYQGFVDAFSNHIISSVENAITNKIMAGLLKRMVDKIPDQFLLNTATWRVFIPTLYHKYPDHDMVLNISAISPPSVRIDVGRIDATVDLDVTVNVLDFGEIVPVACISVSVAVSGAAVVSGNNLAGRVELDYFSFTLKWSEVGKLHTFIVQSVMRIFLKNLFVPYVNSYLAQGFPLPIIKGFSIRDAYILTSDSRIIVSSDVAFIEPEVIYIPCLNQ